ncbi:MAG: dephospho-CoA kinase [Caldilineales bacterium]|nr:dephospho-CoA kinase [Caldilineales bacterium]
MNDSTIIGLTGNIGTGKTTVLRMLAERGAHVIDADEVAHRVMDKDGSAYAAIVEAFGRGILAKDGSIDRQHLGRIVFDNPAKLGLLEQIVHPAVYDVINTEVEQTTASVIVIEAIKLLEAGMASALCDQIWVVTSPQEEQVRRLMDDRNMSRAAAEARMASQSPQAYKTNQADLVIDNSGTLADLEAQIDAAWKAISLRQAA